MRSIFLAIFLGWLHLNFGCGLVRADTDRESSFIDAFSHSKDLAKLVQNTKVTSLLLVLDTSTGDLVQRFKVGEHDEHFTEWQLAQENAHANSLKYKTFLNLSGEKIQGRAPFVCAVHQWNSKTTGDLPLLLFGFDSREDALGFAIAFKKIAIENRRKLALDAKVEK